MAVHFLHVSKAGGTAIRHALREERERAGGTIPTPWGPLRSRHRHSVRLCDVPAGDLAFFVLRDPVARFVSGFSSRQRKGAPRYEREWSPGERRAFERFSTAAELAGALARPRGRARREAELALESIRHLRRRLTLWTGSPEYLRENLHRVVYIARQETLDEDWDRLKELLGLPPGVELPRDDATAHRTAAAPAEPLGPEGLAAVRAWYADDYEVLAIAEEFRRRPEASS